jgi:DNA-binding NarL/FixJ family response regulator
LAFVNDQRQDVQTAHRRVLIADDFPSMQQALVSCLEPFPCFEVVGVAANGREALEQSSELRPDVVVADLQMPVMDGFQLMRELRRLYPQIAIVAISGHFSSAIEKEAFAAGANAFVSKVGLPEALISALNRLS